MLATLKDLPFLTSLLYQECERTRKGGIEVAWSVEEAGLFIAKALSDLSFHIEVERTGNSIQAVCGVKLFNPLLPPHPLSVVEWLWWGKDKKATVRVWNTCKIWAKAQGAQYAMCVLARPQTRPGKFIETYQWVEL